MVEAASFQSVLGWFMETLVGWVSRQSFQFFGLGQNFLLSSLVEGVESCGRFQGVDGCGLQSACGDSHACVLHFGQPAGVALCSGGPRCSSVLQHRTDVSRAHLLQDVAAGSPFGAIQFLHEGESLSGLLLRLLDVWIAGQFLVQFDAQVDGGFFLGELLVVDSDFEGFFGVGGGEGRNKWQLSSDC